MKPTPDASTLLRILAVALNHLYGGWDGRCLALNGRVQDCVEMSCDPVSSHPVVFTAPDGSLAEPVTHARWVQPLARGAGGDRRRRSSRRYNGGDSNVVARQGESRYPTSSQEEIDQPLWRRVDPG